MKLTILSLLAILLSFGTLFAQTKAKKKDPNATVPFTPNPKTDLQSLNHF